MAEFELKFQIPAGHLRAVEAAMRRGRTTSRKLAARYFDTPSGALAAKQLVLRLRREGRAWIQAAKGPAVHFERMEEEAPLAGTPKAPDIALFAGTPAHKAICNALADTGESAADLQPIYAMQVDRLVRVVRAGTTRIEIALDQGEITAAGRKDTICELEFELLEGDAAALIEVAQHWCTAHGLWLDPASKSQRAAQLARGEPASPVKATKADAKVRRTEDLLVGAVGDAFRHALANLREIAAGTAEDEHVHQARVGIRRLRSVLRELGELPELAGLCAEAQDALTAAFLRLGEHRDATVVVPAIEQQIEDAGGPRLRWKPPQGDLPAIACDPALQSALLAVVRWLVDMRKAGSGCTPLAEVRKHVAARLASLQKKALREGGHFVELAQQDRHKVRKRIKRLRYLSELTRGLFRRREVDRFTRGLEALQDALGEFQDTSTALDLWTARSKDEAPALFGAGWLAARNEEHARHCEKQCREARRELQPFWD